MTRDVKNISSAFDLISMACENIRENDRCDDCPMRHICVNDYNDSVIDFADLVSESVWQDFIDYSDECLPSDDLARDMAENALYDSYRDMQYDIALDEMDRGL